MIEIELLKNKKPKKYPILLIITTLSFILLLLSFKYHTYDKIKTIAITNFNNSICTLNIKLPYNNISNLEESKIEYNNKLYEINKVSYNETSIENNIIYEDISLDTNIDCKNKVIDISIVNNKQRIIDKIFKIIKEE